MLAAGNQNPDVRMTGSAAPKSGATVKVEAQINNEEDVLRDMRAIRLGPSPRPKQKHPAHARPGSRPRCLRPADIKTHLARPPATPAPPPPPHRSVPALSRHGFTLFIPCNHAGNGL